MKTAHELMSKLDQVARNNGNGYNNDILKEIQEYESDIRKDQVNKCVGSVIYIPKESIHKKEVVLAIMSTIED